jgi:UDPglucose--hexose-1-phosphate uridylyltransferase
MKHQTEMRLDPLRCTWTVFAESRFARPAHLGERWPKANGLNPFDPAHADLLPNVLHRAGNVRVIPNRVPALRVEGSGAVSADGFYDRMDGTGAHEVVIESAEGHDYDRMSLDEIGQVIQAWKIRMLDLRKDGRMRSFSVMKNVGAAAGASTQHCVSQVVAMALIPPALLQRLVVAREFCDRKKRSIFEDILREETRVGTRITYENNGFALFCPYASRVPFELAIFPKRQCADFHGITDDERGQLADVLHVAIDQLSKALAEPPYQLALFTAPTRTSRRDHWNTIDTDFRWHIEILPLLSPRDSFDLATGCHLNTVMPEIAAECLRKTRG